MPGIGIISNPYSKKNKKKPKRHEYLSYIAGDTGYSVLTRSIEQLSEVATDFKNRQIDILAINGGDGTVSQTISAFVSAYGESPLPKFIPLKGGTINFLSQNLGIRGTPEQILFRLIESFSDIGQLQTTWVNTIRVDEKIGFLYADGTCAHFLEEFYKNKTGPVGSALLLSKILLSRLFHPSFYYRIIKSRETIVLANGKGEGKHESLSVLISSLSKMPFHIPLFKDVSLDPPIAEYISYICSPKEAAYRIPLDLLVSASGSSSAKIKGNGDLFEIENTKPIPYTLDGEIYYPDTNKIKIELGKKLEFVIV